jgi:hypothetical protein
MPSKNNLLKIVFLAIYFVSLRAENKRISLIASALKKRERER